MISRCQLPFTALFLLCLPYKGLAQHDTTWGKVADVDICVYGGTSAGVIAGYSAKRLGHSVVLIEPGGHVGGMTAGGLGETDIGNKDAISGLARDFYRRVGAYYGRAESWIFEPHVAAAVFDDYIRAVKLPVWLHYRLTRVEKKGARIMAIVLERADFATGPMFNSVSGTMLNPMPGPTFIKVRAKVFLDCSYEGDLMAAAGVSYTTGRESNSVYGESYDGWQLRDKHQFPDGIDPYRKPGEPSSGLLWGIGTGASDSTGAGDTGAGTTGAGDRRIQAYNFRLCLTDSPANLIPIDKPARYNPDHYELLLRLINSRPGAKLSAYLNINLMPNRKTDINNNGPFSTDMIGMNYSYPDASYAERRRMWHEHADYTKGLLYFLGHDQRVPEALRTEMLQWGYPRDEFAQTQHWTPQLYIREARRMRGEYVMTQANCQGKEVVTDGIGLAAYTMDSHNCERLVVQGVVKNEGDVQIGGFGPYPIAYRSIVPKKNECDNLLVPVCLSASHIAYGSIRMEPVFMVLGQSAALAAHLAIREGRPVQAVDVTELQRTLRDNPLFERVD
jgi:hypothetical protein